MPKIASTSAARSMCPFVRLGIWAAGYRLGWSRPRQAAPTRRMRVELGIVGLGRMGANMARRLMKDGHTIVAYDVSADAVEALAGEAATAASSLEELAAKLTAPRSVWVMVPAGKITEETVEGLEGVLESGDAIIDGGNSYYRDDMRRAKRAGDLGIDYIDCGTSGGVFGLERGYCLMIGGPDEAVERLDSGLASPAPGGGSAPRTPWLA